MFNRTKIVATIGPASNTKETIIALINEGVDVFRLNFSHGTHEEHGSVIQLIQEINEEFKTHVGILADLQGPKIRLGKVEGDKFEVKTGDLLAFTTKVLPAPGTRELLHVTYAELAKDVRPGQKILIDDGKIELRVIESNGTDEVRAVVLSDGFIASKKGINLPETDISAASLSDKDKDDLRFIFKHNVNWIALSFVRTAHEITQLKGIIGFNQHHAKVIAKIERPEAVKNIDEIIQVSDAIMVARGDLGVEIPLEEVPLIQKEIVQKCVAAAKPVIIATQMMESMITSPMPSRAEITDVANAVLDGADALMLSGETAMGDFPVKVIQTFTRIITKVESHQMQIFNKNHPPVPSSPTFLSDAVCFNACKMAEYVKAVAIVGITVSGYTAFTLASHRPQAAIFIFTSSKKMLDMFSLIWGVRAFFYDHPPSTEETMITVRRFLRERGYAQKGDVIIHTASIPLSEGGRTNAIKLGVINGD
jgi:pyruvate kinase